MLTELGTLFIHVYAALLCALAFMLTFAMDRHRRRNDGNGVDIPCRMALDGVQTILVVSIAVHAWAAISSTYYVDDLAAKVALRTLYTCLS